MLRHHRMGVTAMEGSVKSFRPRPFLQQLSISPPRDAELTGGRHCDFGTDEFNLLHLTANISRHHCACAITYFDVFRNSVAPFLRCSL